MNCCENCKYWFGDCGPTRDANRVKNHMEWSNCDRADGDEHGPFKPGLAYAEGCDKDSTAMLMTHRDFGCNQWEAK